MAVGNGREPIADRSIRTLGLNALLGWRRGFSRLCKVPGHCLALGLGRAARPLGFTLVGVVA